jgi:hypothetical protein
VLLLAALSPMPLWASEVPVERSTPAGWPPILRDIAGRLPANTDARDADLVTYTHEGSHFLCRGRPGHHGIYILDGRRHWVPTPPLVTERVMAAVPEDQRGSIYPTYLRQGRTEYWSRQPLMILDEWTAYLHGSIARRELSLDARQESDRNCLTFARYAGVLWRMAKECEGYDATELQRFCRWNLARCKEAIPDQTWDVSFD